MPTRALLLKLSIFLVINSISAGCIVESGCSHSAGCCFSQQKTHQSGIGSRVHSMPADVKSNSSYHHFCCHASDSQACNLSQLQSSNAPGSRWAVPTELYAPIEQQAVLLKDTSAGRDFLTFVRSPEAVAIIRQFGYAVP